MQKIIFRAEIFKESNLYVSICPELNVSSFGETVEEAKHSLYEAVEAFIEECQAMGTLEEVMSEKAIPFCEGSKSNPSNKHIIRGGS